MVYYYDYTYTKAWWRTCSFGVYQGGRALTTEHKFSKKNSHISTTQLQIFKVLAQCEYSLHTSRDNMTVLKFDRKLEINYGNSYPTELDQGQLMKAAKAAV